MSNAMWWVVAGLAMVGGSLVIGWEQAGALGFVAFLLLLLGGLATVVGIAKAVRS